MANRGELTPEVLDLAKDFLRREITRDELRLYPYLQYVMLNERKLDPIKMTVGERAIVSALRSEGHIEGGASGLAMTREFWDFLCRVLWVAYATFDCRELETA